MLQGKSKLVCFIVLAVVITAYFSFGGEDSSNNQPINVYALTQQPSREIESTVDIAPIQGPALTPPSSKCVSSSPFAVVSENETFPFWGKQQNIRAPCPTSGMNNQLAMLMGLLKCVRDRGIQQFLWKDVTCSPTGGKDGGHRYEVGGKDYEYAWFRWSSVIDVQTADICLNDKHAWSEHGAWIKSCPTTTHAFYNTKTYWDLRILFDFHPQFYEAAEEFLKRNDLFEKKYVAVHIRKGDYSKFCADTSKGSGVRKYLIAPYLKLKGTHEVHRSFIHQCDPPLASLADSIARVAGNDTQDVFLSTNSPEVRELITKTLPTRGFRVICLEGDTIVSEYSKTQKVVMSLIMLSKGYKKLLNRYSTFSQTSIDLANIHSTYHEPEHIWWW